MINLKEMEEKQRLNRLKSKYECVTCEVVVPKDMIEEPMSIVQGSCGVIEIAAMICNLEDIINCLKNTFPEVKKIYIKLRKHGRMKEAYKCITQEWEK